MAIPESQLDTWSHQGSITQSSNTYNAIKNVLEAPDTPYATKNYSVFLQGSYGNDTNIYAESDVDIVIRISDVFHSDLDELTDDEKAAYHSTFPNAAYTLSDFKRDVLGVLVKQYGSDVTSGDKAIALAQRGNRRKADVIVATEFRRYWKFNGQYDQRYDEGICFFNSKGERIANYPKQHSENLTSKHQDSGRWLKPMVRVLKNLRTTLVDDGILKAGVAPSYYLEGLLYNVPNDKFATNYGTCFVNAFNWIQDEADKTQLLCANRQYYLLRDNSHTCWPVADGDAFISAAIALWNNW